MSEGNFLFPTSTFDADVVKQESPASVQIYGPCCMSLTEVVLCRCLGKTALKSRLGRKNDFS